MIEKFTPADTALAEAALETLAAMDDLLAYDGDPSAKASPSALHAYATDPRYQPDAPLLHLLAVDDAVQADFQRLLTNTSTYHMPQMAAASSGDIESREVNGCKIVFRPSRADPEQLYAIIEITDPELTPSMLFVRHPDGGTDRLELPVFQNARAQLLLDRQSSEARGLMDTKAEVYVT